MVRNMFRNKGYIFTNRKYSKVGIMSTILGILSSITLGSAIYLSYQSGGKSSVRYGTAALLAEIFMFVGFILAVYSSTEKDRFKLFTVLGLLANVLAFGMLSLILYAGAYVEG